jgi:iron complex outermembrane receptor protein
MTDERQTGGAAFRAGRMRETAVCVLSVLWGAMAVPADAEPRESGGGLPPAADGGKATTLDTVTVMGEGTADVETAWGPVKGYVAKQSAAGTKTDTPLIETPQTVNVVTRDEITARASQNISQAAAYTPGAISEVFSPSTRDDYFYLRGFEAAQYLDGTRLLGVSNGNYANLRIEPYMLERFELLRGPSSMLYGQNPPGGLVNMVSKRPLDVPFHEIEILGGSFDRVQGMLDLSGPIDDDHRYLYRLTGLVRGSDTQVDFAKDDRYFVAPSFTWRPDDDTSLTFLSHYQKDVAGNVMQFYPAQGTRLPNPNGRIATERFLGEPGYDRFEREQYGVGYAFEHHFNQTWQVRQNLRYTGVTTDYPVVNALGFVTDANGNIADYRTVARYASLYLDNADTFTLDNQVQADFDTGPVRHQVLAGVDYRNISGGRKRGISEPPNDPANLDVYSPVYGQPFPAPPIDYRLHQDRDQVGLYGQDQLKYDRWIATIGVRQDWVSAYTREDDRYGGVQTLTDTRQDDHSFTYRTALSYVFDVGVAPYFSYSESFEPEAGTNFYGTPFVPTTGQQYEVGVKYQPNGWNALVTLSFFHLTQQNLVTPDPDPLHVGYGIQTGEARSQGIELEGKASLTEGLNLTTAYSYVDSDVTKTNETGQLGNELPFTPKHQGSAWADYTFQDGPVAGFGLGGGVRVVGSNYGDLGNSLKAPSYTLIDAAFHYDLGKAHESLKGARLAVNINNLFDRQYVTTCFDSNACFYGNRQTVLASLRYNW